MSGKMTMATLLELQLGDVLVAGALMPSITNEPLTHTITASDPETKAVHLTVHYFGIRMGQLIARSDEKGGVVYTPVYA